MLKILIFYALFQSLFNFCSLLFVLYFKDHFLLRFFFAGIKNILILTLYEIFLFIEFATMQLHREVHHHRHSQASNFRSDDGGFACRVLRLVEKSADDGA